MMAHDCPKHVCVENRNKHIWKRIVRQVGYLQRVIICFVYVEGRKISLKKKPLDGLLLLE